MVCWYVVWCVPRQLACLLLTSPPPPILLRSQPQGAIPSLLHEYFCSSQSPMGRPRIHISSSSSSSSSAWSVASSSSLHTIRRTIHLSLLLLLLLLLSHHPSCSGCSCPLTNSKKCIDLLVSAVPLETTRFQELNRVDEM